MFLVMGVLKLQQHVKIVKLITNPQGQGRPAPFVLQEPILLRETPPVLHVILRAQLVSKHQPHVLPAISIFNLPDQGQPALHVCWAHILQLEMLAA